MPHPAAQAERDEAVDAARAQLSGDGLVRFDELLAANQTANFAWWNEDHNYYIDLRATIPLRRGALALSEAVDADAYDDGLFLFYREILSLCAGNMSWSQYQSLATARQEYYATTTTSARRCPRWLAPCRRRWRIPY